MIKLTRSTPPACLSPTGAAQLTAEYATSKASVWNRDDIKDALLTTSHNKCAYCETMLQIESQYVEVEHFHFKNDFPHLVVDWDNLLPSCKRCNGKKGTHNVVDDPIVNPYIDLPTDHLGLRLYRITAKTAAGQMLIETLDLNNHDRAVIARFEIGEKIIELVDLCATRLTAFQDISNTRNRNRLVGSVEGLLRECQETAQYSATSATILHGLDEYHSVVAGMKAGGVWSQDLEDLHVKSSALRLT